jgi:putative Holliday junction resolvase
VTRLLGIDLGERRIGVAIADGDGSGARPLTTLRRQRDPQADAEALRALIATHEVGEVVVGLPLEAAGHEGAQAAITRDWLADVLPGLGEDTRVTLRDERLTSHLAESRIGPMKRGRSGGPPSRTQRDAHRARIDREAAAIILQDELDARAGAATPAPQTAPARPMETDV